MYYSHIGNENLRQLLSSQLLSEVTRIRRSLFGSTSRHRSDLNVSWCVQFFAFGRRKSHKNLITYIFDPKPRPQHHDRGAHPQKSNSPIITGHVRMQQHVLCCIHSTVRMTCRRNDNWSSTYCSGQANIKAWAHIPWGRLQQSTSSRSGRCTAKDKALMPPLFCSVAVAVHHMREFASRRVPCPSIGKMNKPKAFVKVHVQNKILRATRHKVLMSAIVDAQQRIRNHRCYI